jgi:hypothetical protein
MRSREAGLDDDARHRLITLVTKGRVSSGADVSDEEAPEIFAALHAIKTGKATVDDFEKATA